MFLNKFFKIKTKLIKSSEYSNILSIFSDLQIQGVLKLFYYFSLNSNCLSVIHDITKDNYFKVEEEILNNKSMFFKKIKLALEEDSFSKKESLSVFNEYIDISNLSKESLDISFYLNIELINEFKIHDFLSSLDDFVIFNSFLDAQEAIGILLFMKALSNNYDDEIDAAIFRYEELSKSNFISTLITLENFDSEFKIRKHLKILESNLI